MAHLHSVGDNDKHFSIRESTRAIRARGKVTLIQGDHNSERISFDMPRHVDDHDMLQCDVVKIHYINTGETGTTEDVYDVKDLQASPENEDVAVFSWLISGNATKHVGPLQFAIEFQCTTDGVVDYAWHTGICEEVSVSAGMNHGAGIVEEYSDILEQWRERLFKNLVTTENIQEAVDNALAAAKESGAFDGKDGEPGADGVGVTHEWIGTKLRVTSASGTSEADLKGEPGNDGEDACKNIVDGDDGAIRMLGAGESLGQKAAAFNLSKASGNYAHAENLSTASGAYAHSEGSNTEASAHSAHAEGVSTKASGGYSHSEGGWTEANGDYSHSEGYGTVAAGKHQHVQGRANIKDEENRYAHIVGNGSIYGDNPSNAHTVDWNGNAWYQGSVYIGGTSQDDAQRLVTEKELEEAVKNAGGGTGGGGSSIDDTTPSSTSTYSSEKIEEMFKATETGIKRVESLDTTTPGGLVNLRDLETGLYVLYGYFSPYANSDMSMTFDNTMVVVSRKNAGSHFLVFTGLNSKVNFLEILVDESQPGGHTYTRTDLVMLDMHNLIAKVGDLAGLTTEDKSSIVAAINEVAQSSGEGGGLPTGGEPNMMLVTDGDGNAKWDERTHWKEEGLLDILPETTVTMGEEGYYGTEPFAVQLEVGKTYTVTWNGAVYTSTAVEAATDSGTMTAIGNLAVMGLEVPDTGEPYVILQLPEEQASAMGVYYGVMALDGSAEVTIKVQGDGAVYHPLDRKYLPSYMYGEEVSPEETYYEQTTIPAPYMDNAFMIDKPFAKNLIVGNEYTVMYNGLPIKCIAKNIGTEGVPIIAVGYDDIFSIQQLFDLESDGIYGIVIAYDYAETVTFSIVGRITTIYKVDRKYLPAAENGNILNGIAPGSIRSITADAEDDNYSLGENAIALGYSASAKGNGAVSLGGSADGSGAFSAIGGCADGGSSIAMGAGAIAHNSDSIALGMSASAKGDYSVAIGKGASTDARHAIAFGESAVAYGDNQTVFGKFNVIDNKDVYAYIIGNGEWDGSRSNAHTLDWDGNAWFAGTVEGTALILKSSTSGSTKRFRITVDDSGTITATAL